MTHEEAQSIVFELMHRYLGQVGGTMFTAEDFKAMVNSLSAEEYMEKREAIAAFRLRATP